MATVQQLNGWKAQAAAIDALRRAESGEWTILAAEMFPDADLLPGTIQADLSEGQKEVVTREYERRKGEGVLLAWELGQPGLSTNGISI
jgi:hypothetical protein